MNEIIKNCHKHGDLSADQIIKAGLSYGKKRYKCKKCMKESHRKNYLLHKATIYEKTRKWKKNNVEKCKELNKKYRIEKISSPKLSIPKQAENITKFIRARSKLIHLLWDIEKVMRKCR
jgi:uncharacterized NAD(P)/FAD-binding protein YdhS